MTIGCPTATPWLYPNLSTLADLNALFYALGGNANNYGVPTAPNAIIPSAVYDCRTGSTLPTSWPDARSSSPSGILGPALAQGAGGATAPTQAATGAPVVFAAAGKLMTAASNANYTPLNTTMVLVLNSAGTASATFGSLNAATPVLQIGTSAGPNYQSVIGNAPTTTASTIAATSGPIKVVAAGTVTYSGNIFPYIWVYNQPIVIGSTAISITSAASTIEIGGATTGGTSFACSVYNMMIFPFQLNVAQLQLIGSWAMQTFLAIAS